MSPRGVAIAALVGTTMEWYDFYLYSTSIPLVLSQLFFPSADPLMSSLVAFSSIGVGFIARPIGGLVLAHFGDRFGRKKILLFSLLMMGIPTIGIGLLPTYAQVGVLAPVLLVSLRFLQGIAVGGEWGGAVLLAVEHAPPEKRVRYGAYPQFGAPLGLATSCLIMLGCQLLPREALLDWGWRIPFLLSAALVVLGLVLRLKLEEPQQFIQARDRGDVPRVPLLKVFREHRRAVLAGTAAVVVGQAAYILVNFVPTYAKSAVDTSDRAAVASLAFGAIAGLVLMIFVARRAGQRDRRRYAFWGGILPALWSFPAFLLPLWLGTWGLWISVTVSYLGVWGYYTVAGSLLADQFPAGVRYTGISLCMQIAAFFAGGLLPITVSVLVTATGGQFWPAAVLMMAAGLVTAVAAPFLRGGAWPAEETDVRRDAEVTGA